MRRLEMSAGSGEGRAHGRDVATSTSTSTSTNAGTGVETAWVKEIFLSFQGEGLLVGERQIFVRLAGCNIRCPWCDTPDALVTTDAPVARIEDAPGSGRFHEIRNPLGPGDVLREVRRIVEEHGPVRWVSITGGEPTIWPRFLGELCPALQREGLKVFLETNSHYPDALRALGTAVDFVSADVKIPFADYTIDREVYVELLRLARRGGVQAKVVVGEGFPDADVVEAARLVARADRGIPLILQPVTPLGGARPPAPSKLLELQRRCLEVLDDVRVIPQTHKIVGAL